MSNVQIFIDDDELNSVDEVNSKYPHLHADIVNGHVRITGDLSRHRILINQNTGTVTGTKIQAGSIWGDITFQSGGINL